MSQYLPFTKARAVTPSDTTKVHCSAFFVGVGGDVAILARDDDTAITLTGCLAGTVYYVSCEKIMSTNTTATDIVALY